MNNDNIEKEFSVWKDLLIKEYQEAKSDLRLHNQLIWTVISIFFATIGIFYIGYVTTIGSNNILLAIISSVLGYSFSIIITLHTLTAKRRWSIDIERRDQMKKLLLEIPQKNETKLSNWIKKAKELYKKTIDEYFDEIVEGEWVIKFLHGYRIKQKSTSLNLLCYLCVIIGIWSFLLSYAIIKVHFFNNLCPQTKLMVVIIGTIILFLLALLFVWKRMRTQKHFKNLKKLKKNK